MVVLAIPKYIRIASACSRESKYADPRTGSDVNEKTCSRRGGWIAGAASRPRHSGPDGRVAAVTARFTDAYWLSMAENHMQRTVLSIGWGYIGSTK